VVLQLTGSASRRVLDRSPIVISVDGRPAIDLDLLEGRSARRRGWALLDPRAPLRRLRVAWQVGRLRGGLPGLADDLIAQLDRDLAAVPPMHALTDDELLVLLERGGASLRAAHGYELLAGSLADDGGGSAAAMALTSLAAGRRIGLPDDEIVASDPSVLALTPPTISPRTALPPIDDSVAEATARPRSPMGRREALRLRIRWLHELEARAAWEIGTRLVAAGRLAQPGQVAHVGMAHLAASVRSGAPIERPAPASVGPPLPARFRLAADGSVVADHDPGAGSDGTPAGGGRGIGPVANGSDPRRGSVLVTHTLDPRLASVLPSLAGLVSETGSPLSHLAILAREHGVPTVVAVADAVRRFPPGTELLVDGASGEIRAIGPTVDLRSEDR
jgi:pyruvate,water dikinase